MTLHVCSLSAQPMGLVMIIPTAIQERNDDPEIPSDVSVYESCNLSVSSERESGALAQQEHYKQEADVERLTGIPSEHAPGDHVGGDAPDPIQSDGPERECQQPRAVLSNIEILQLWAEPRGVVLSGRSSSQWTRKQECSPLS